MFSRSAQAEAEVKTFGVSKTVAIRIHERLKGRIEQTILISGLPLIKSTEATQSGDTFGQRLANAVSDCWEQGFEKLIIVGGDAPELSASDIVRAQFALDAGRPTLGKDFRGGSFLIGLLKDGFRQNQFAELPWQTKSIAGALKEELGLTCQGEEIGVFVLGSRADCNSQQDFSCFVKRTASRVWANLLQISSGRLCELHKGFELVSCFGESTTSRGPPAKLHLAA